MIRLFEWLTQESLDLHYSLEESGIQGTSIVLNDDGFLPEGIISPYTFFCEVEMDGSPLYFNQLEVPYLWQITGTNTEGEIWNRSSKRGVIHYHDPKYLRFVQSVDWLYPDGSIYMTDHYNKYGWVFARTYFFSDQQVSHKKYFTKSGQEILSENILTGDILLNWKGKVYHFTKKVDFFLFYLKKSGLDLSSIWYNSLGMPFLLSYYLGGEGRDILFWQENLTDQLPGNMQVIFSGRSSRTKKVVVQDRSVYKKLLHLVEEKNKEMISFLNILYPKLRENYSRKEILIVTNSDQIEGIETLTDNLSAYTFHIGALTGMSDKLQNIGQKENVLLYPNMSPKTMLDLLEQCDIYLDINHGNEVLSIVRQAFERSLLILAYDNTVHSPIFHHESGIFNHSKPQTLSDWLLNLDDYSQTVSCWRSDLFPMTYIDYKQVLVSNVD